MSELSPSLTRLVEEMHRVTGETDDAGTIVNALSAPLRAAALARDWIEDRYFECDPEQGFGVHLLHEEADHSLAVLAVAWLSGRSAPVHDHGTWAVVAVSRASNATAIGGAGTTDHVPLMPTSARSATT